MWLTRDTDPHFYFKTNQKLPLISVLLAFKYKAREIDGSESQERNICPLFSALLSTITLIHCTYHLTWTFYRFKCTHTQLSVAYSEEHSRWASSPQLQVLLHQFSLLYRPSLRTQTRPTQYIGQNRALASRWISR